MKYFINKDKIIEAFIEETSNGDWQIILIVGYDSENNPCRRVIPQQSEGHCIETLIDLGLTQLLYL